MLGGVTRPVRRSSSDVSVFAGEVRRLFRRMLSLLISVDALVLFLGLGDGDGVMLGVEAPDADGVPSSGLSLAFLAFRRKRFLEVGGGEVEPSACSADTFRDFRIFRRLPTPELLAASGWGDGPRGGGEEPPGEGNLAESILANGGDSDPLSSGSAACPHKLEELTFVQHRIIKITQIFLPMRKTFG